MTLRPLRRAARRLLAAAARRLSPARGEALVAGTHAVFTVITGRRTAAGRRREQRRKAERPARRPSPSERQPSRTEVASAGPASREQLSESLREEIERAERALSAGHFAAAVARSARLVDELPTNVRILELHAAALAGVDDEQAHALALHRLHVVRDDPDVRRRERVAAGRVAVLSPGWLPSIPNRPAATPAADDAAVLVLAEESAPYRATRTTDQLRTRLETITAAGFRPQVITALGFPRSIGVTEVASVETVDGIPHHRLDLGPFYPKDAAADVRLRDAAWLAAGVAREVAPARIHAIVGPNDLDVALVAAALARHLRLPFVVEVVGARGRTATVDAASQQAGVARVIEAADGVISADAASDDIRAVYLDVAARHVAATTA